MLHNLDRPIIVLNEYSIEGNTRFQKHAFVISQNYKKELKDLNFYSDWKPHYYGPYSEELAKDIDECIKQRLIDKYETVALSGRPIQKYTLTIRGRKRFRELFQEYEKLLKNIYEFSANLKQKPMMIILKEIYLAYPQYTTNSEIKDQVISD